MADFARILVKAVQELAADDDAPADAGADKKTDHIPGLPGGAIGVLPQNTDVAIIVDIDWLFQQPFELLFEGGLLPGQVRALDDHPLLHVQGAGRAHTHRPYTIPGDPGVDHGLAGTIRHAADRCRKSELGLGLFALAAEDRALAIDDGRIDLGAPQIDADNPFLLRFSHSFQPSPFGPPRAAHKCRCLGSVNAISDAGFENLGDAQSGEPRADR
ncbi:MAG: hypothetical protein BWY77_01072 [bacterium ADurb.Bin431]|nr:MAG: hypothetical protein BWY77_01072 [bacterium ADurb.Bin431]